MNFKNDCFFVKKKKRCKKNVLTFSARHCLLINVALPMLSHYTPDSTQLAKPMKSLQRDAGAHS